MHSALMGGLVGMAIAIALFAFEYSALVNASKERAKKNASKRIELDPSERARLRSTGGFCVILPVIGAGLGWLLF